MGSCAWSLSFSLARSLALCPPTLTVCLSVQVQMGGSVALLMLFGFPFMRLLAHQPLLLWVAFTFQRLLDVVSGLVLSLSRARSVSQSVPA